MDNRVQSENLAYSGRSYYLFTGESVITESYHLDVNSYIVKLDVVNKFMDSVSEVGLYWLLLNMPPKNS